MAIILFGGGTSDLRGSAGGNTWSKNAFGNYQKSKPNPKTNKTERAYIAKGNFIELAQMWSATLTQVQRDAWIAARPNFPQTNVFGQTILLTGFALFQKFNGNLKLIGQNVILLPPVPTAVPANTSLELSANIAMEEVFGQIIPNPTPASVLAPIYITAPYPQGVSNYNNRLRLGGITTTGGGQLSNLFLAYVRKFGSLISGQKISTLIYNIDTSTGIESGKLTVTCTIDDFEYFAYRMSGVVGTFVAGEAVLFSGSGATGDIYKVYDSQTIAISNRVGVPSIGQMVTGGTSGATGFVSHLPARVDISLTADVFIPSSPIGQGAVIVNNTLVNNGYQFSGDQLNYIRVLVDTPWFVGDTISQAGFPKSAIITDFNYL